MALHWSRSEKVHTRLITCVRQLLQLALLTETLTSPLPILSPPSFFLFSLSMVLVPYFQLASVPPDANVKESGYGEAGSRCAAHEVAHPVCVIEQAICRLLALLAPDEAGTVQHRPVDDWGGEEGKKGEEGDEDDEGGGFVPWLDGPEANDGPTHPAG